MGDTTLTESRDSTAVGTGSATERTSTTDVSGARPPSIDVDNDIETLARQLTQASQTIGNELKVYCPDPGSQLDPQSPSFNARAWAKALIKLSETDPNAAPSRFLGVAFRNLSTYGWSTGAESQPTVTNLVARTFSSVASLIGVNRKQRIDILRDFEGVVGEGELLLVLGPPGSGCSTLLKTLAGETSGFKISDDSYMNYRGKFLLYSNSSFLFPVTKCNF